MKQVDTKKLVLACLVIMVLMIIYTKIDQSRQQKTETVEIENEAKSEKAPGSLLLTGQLTDALSGSEESEDAEAEAEQSKEEGEILGPAEKMNLKTARKEPYGLVVELDYVSASKISLHGIFGYMVYTLKEEDGTVTAELTHAVTLEELGGFTMGGAAYTDVIGGDGCALIVPGIHNEEIARRRRFLYIEETNEITGGIVAPDWMMKKVSNNDYSDAVVKEELTSELMALLKEKEHSKLLYGPAVIPEYNSNTYGFLAENGENLENVWYGLWNRDLGTVTKIHLFSETVKP